MKSLERLKQKWKTIILSESAVSLPKKSAASLSGSAGQEVRAACAEINGIAEFLTTRKINQQNISEWKIISAVLDRILLICFVITFIGKI